MSRIDLLAPSLDDDDKRPTASLKSLARDAERARVLFRLLHDDPHDEEARRAIAQLGLDKEDAEYVQQFIPSDLVEDTRQEIPAPEDAAWIRKLMNEARAFASVGLVQQGVEMLETVLRIDKHNDIALALWFELSAQVQSAHLPVRPRGDDTLQIRVG